MWNSTCYRLNCVLLHDSYVEVLIFSVTVFEDKVREEVIKVNWGHKIEALIQ